MHRPVRFPSAFGLGACVAALVLTACSDTAGPDTSPIEELPRALTRAEVEVIAGTNSFGLELLARVAAADERANVLLSPLSATMALGMTLEGAEGETWEAMRRTLGFGGMERAEVTAAYRDLIDLLTGLDHNVRFSIGNAVWADEGVPFHDAFFETVRAAFDAEVATLDFGDPASLGTVNAWVSGATEGRIPAILESLPPNLVMLLVNAIWFEGAWTTRFDPADTRPRPFTREDGTTVEVPTMTLEDVELPTARTEDYVAVELPYGRGAYAMVAVVPQGPVADSRRFVEGLDADGWRAIVDALEPAPLEHVALPKLELAYDIWLNEALKDLGMGIAFGREADFSRMSPMGQDMCISFVRQKTFMEVDEAGTRAAAATAVGVGVVSLGPHFAADRPYLLAIRERHSGTILFAGWIGDPSKVEVPSAQEEPVDCW